MTGVVFLHDENEAAFPFAAGRLGRAGKIPLSAIVIQSHEFSSTWSTADLALRSQIGLPGFTMRVAVSCHLSWPACRTCFGERRNETGTKNGHGRPFRCSS